VSHDHLLARHDIASPNHSTRGGHPIRALVIHTTAGFWPTDRDYLCNPNPANGKPVSSHYIISPPGEAWQLVDEAEASWANGIMNKPRVSIPIVAQWFAAFQPPHLAGIPNLETVSIEVSGKTGMAWTSAQRQTLVSLGGDICRRHGIGARDVLRHADLDSVNRPYCPGLAEDGWRLLVSDIMTAAGQHSPANTDQALDAEYARLGGEATLGEHGFKGRLTWTVPWTSFDGDVLVCSKGIVGIDPAATDVVQRLLLDAGATWLAAAGKLKAY